jgi:RNA polymerase sigma-70 factor (ECF subfamily)
MDATPPARNAPVSTETAAGRDDDLLALLAQGAVDEAFSVLARRYESKVHRLCVALLRDHAAAQDAAQESLVRVWRALPRYDGRAALSTWIYAITRNRCLTALSEPGATVSMSEEAVWAEAEAVAQEPAAMDAEGVVRQLVAGLPEVPRRVLTLYYFEDMALAEVARMLGQPQGTVKTHLFRARGALLRELQARGLGDARQWFA